MKILLSILFFHLYILCFSQTKQQRLLVAEYRIDSPRVGKYTYLVSYNFVKGKYTSKDTVFQAPVFKDGVTGSYVRYDLGNNFVYKNKYVVAGNGAVIDTKKGMLVREQSDNFTEAIGDTLIFYRRNFITGTGYLSLDLTTGNYKFIKDSTWYTPKKRRRTPNGKYYLSIDRSKIPYQVCLNDNLGNKTVLVQDAGHGPYTIDTQFPDIETHWLNNNSFLYVVHKPNKDPSNNIFYKIILHRYNIQEQTDDIFFTFDSVPKPKMALNGRFFIDPVGQTIYKGTSGKSYIIDTTNQKLIDSKYFQLGYDFSDSSTKGGRSFQYKNKDIGELWCIKPIVAEGALAVMYGDPESNLGYPKGLKVWTRKTREWATIDVPWISTIIGWISE